MSFARPPPSMKFDSSVSPKFRSRETSNISRCDSQQLVHATCDTNSFKVTSNSGCCWARTQAFSIWQRSGVLDARVYDLYNIFLSCCSCWLEFQGIKAEKLTLHNATADAFSFLVEDIAERVDSKGPAQIWRSRLRYIAGYGNQQSENGKRLKSPTVEIAIPGLTSRVSASGIIVS